MINPADDYKTPDGETPKDANTFVCEADNESFKLEEEGCYWRYVPGGQTQEKSVRICDWLKVEATTKDTETGEGGIIVRFKTKDGAECERYLSRSLIAATGEKLINELYTHCLQVETAAYSKKGNLMALNRYLKAVISSAELPERKIIPRAGWTDETFSSFLFRNGCISVDDSSRFILSQDAPPMSIESKGTLEEWQVGINKLAIYSVRLRFAVAVSLAAPLVPILIKEGNRLFHFFGRSGRGKSTILHAARSVWGRATDIYKFKASKNGLEEIFATRNHLPFIGDEVKQLSSQGLEDLAFTYGEGKGKQRSDKGQKAQKLKEWRGLAITAGEQGLAEMKAERLRGLSAATIEGEMIRFLNIPAMAGKWGVFDAFPSELMPEEEGGEYKPADGEELNGDGIWEGLDKEQHGYVGDAISYLNDKAFGTAGKAFIEHVERDIAESGLDVFKEDACELMEEFKKRVRSSGSSQTRVLESFALVALAGELAIGYGVLPWERGQLIEDAASIFDAWASSEGTPEQQTENAIEEILGAVERSNAYARYQWDGSMFVNSKEYGARGTNLEGIAIENKEGILCTIYQPKQFKKVQKETEVERTRLIDGLVKRGLLFKPSEKDHYGQCQINTAVPAIGIVTKRGWYFILLNGVNLAEDSGAAARVRTVEEVKSALGMKGKELAG